jgi:hypothetical protein
MMVGILLRLLLLLLLLRCSFCFCSCCCSCVYCSSWCVLLHALPC